MQVLDCVCECMFSAHKFVCVCLCVCGEPVIMCGGEYEFVIVVYISMYVVCLNVCVFMGVCGVYECVFVVCIR